MQGHVLTCYFSSGKCPVLHETSDTSTRELSPLPEISSVSRILNTVLFLHITASKSYSAWTRPFLESIAPIDEDSIVAALKNPTQAVEEAQKLTDATKQKHADMGKAWRVAGTGIHALSWETRLKSLIDPIVGLAAITGGVLVGVSTCAVVSSCAQPHLNTQREA